MKTLSEFIKRTEKFIAKNNIRTISFDVDGTLYPMSQIKNQSFSIFKKKPFDFLKFLFIKQKIEIKRYFFHNLKITKNELNFFEIFFTNYFLNEELVVNELKIWLNHLRSRDFKVLFLSDHGTELKLNKLELSDVGISLNCLRETQKLKPHNEISILLKNKYQIDPSTHLHLGDRSCDENQAESFGCSFLYLKAEEFTLKP